MSRDFNGSTDKINCGSPGGLDDEQPFTVSAWVYPDSRGEGSGGAIVAKDSGAGTGFWLFRYASGDPWSLRFSKDFDVADIDVVTATTLPAGAWQHVTASWDGTADAANGVKIYINAVEATYIEQTSGATTANSDAALLYTIGNDSAAGRTWDGRIAFVEFHNKVLVASQIQQIMRRPGSLPASLRGFWPLWGASPEQDYGPFNNSGTLTGTTIHASQPPVLSPWCSF